MSLISGTLMVITDNPPCPACGHPDWDDEIMSIGCTKIDSPLGAGVERRWVCFACRRPIPPELGRKSPTKDLPRAG
jgi:hypothetical protein